MDTIKMNKKILFVVIIAFYLISACQTSEAILAPLPTETISPTIKAIKPTGTITSTPTKNTQTPTQPTSLSATSTHRLTLMAVGDIMLGRSIGELIETEGFEAPFLYTADTLKTADITLGNLECPLSNRGVAEDKIYAFRAPTEAVNALAYAGFDVVGLANNHILDYGPLALEDTLNHLASMGIHGVGAGMDEAQAYQPTFVDINGLRLAFLAYADIAPGNYDYLSWEASLDKAGIAWAHSQRISKGVRAAKEKADVVIVLVHNGYEFVETVSRFQQETAKLAIDSGASLVIGSHPHVLQRIEPYDEGLIVYSLGNFVFDNFLFPPNYSAILKVEITTAGVESYELIDVVVQLNGVPQIMPYKRPQ